MKSIHTIIELTNLLAKFSGPVRVKIKTKTEVIMRKKDVVTKTIANPFPTIYKLQELVVELNANYEDKVNDARLLEGKSNTFRAEGLVWGEAVDNVLIKKDDQFYIKTIVIKSIGTQTFIANDGRVIPKTQLEPFLPAPTPAKKQGLDDEVVVRTFKLSSIIEIDFDNKVKYVSSTVV
jgi:hypothetical protein